jgi:rRNA maturation endonuclease Nob1
MGSGRRARLRKLREAYRSRRRNAALEIGLKDFARPVAGPALANAPEHRRPCRGCGAELVDNTRSCPSCGAEPSWTSPTNGASQ